MKLLLFSVGFTFFADRVQGLLGIDYLRANMLEVEGGVLTGRGAERNIIEDPRKPDEALSELGERPSTIGTTIGC